MGFALIYVGCGESLNGIDPSRIHCMSSTVFYSGWAELLTDVPFKD